MSKIDEQIKKLRDLEAKLERDKRKIEFLNHILASAREYTDSDFKEVRDDVVALLSAFVERATVEIEGRSEVQPAPVQPITTPPESQAPSAPVKARNPDEGAMKLSFALDNRHLGGKRVSIANDQNMAVYGKVVGLDAPFVVVLTETGPTIKVPVDKVSLVQ